MSLVDSAMKAAIRLMPARAPDALIEARRVVGQPQPRRDGTPKVMGRARFAAEVSLEGMAYAALAYSAIARGRIAAMDTAAAESAPGVLWVMTHRNAPRISPPPVMMVDATGAAASKLPVMQDDSIHWNGEPIALVVAETQEQAEHAASLIKVTYEASHAELSFDKASAKAREPASVMGEPSRIATGVSWTRLVTSPTA